MAKKKNEMELTPNESRAEKELSDELRMLMQDEADALSPESVPRRAFLKRIVQVTLPVGIVLATAGNASACWLCDEQSGCQASCLLCHANSGCQAGCLLVDSCGTKEHSCGTHHAQCGTCLTDL